MGTTGATTFDEADHIYQQGMEHWWRGERPKACRYFRQALKVDPSHADAHNHLGIVELERGRLGAAEKHFEAAVDGGAQRITGELGQVPWGILENRPYLRGLANLALACGRRGRWADVVEIYERLLRLNPNDNQGIRWMIGEAYHRIGQLDTAVEAYRQAQEEAGCCYGLALALHQQGRDSEAGAALVRAFARNFYVPPMLLGERWSRVPGWYGTNMREPEWASARVESSRDLWRAAPGALELLRRWWTAEPVQRWLKDLQRVMRELDTKPSAEERSRLLHEQSALESDRTARLVAGEVEPEAGGRVAPRKRMHPATPDQVRIVRTEAGATVEYADDAVGSVTYKLDDALRQMDDEELLQWHNEGLAAVAEYQEAHEYVALEIPPGSPQIELSKLTGAWLTRGSVLRCRIGTRDREPIVIVDDIALDMEELGMLLEVYEGWGMRITFVPEDELADEPTIEVGEPKKGGGNR